MKRSKPRGRLAGQLEEASRCPINARRCGLSAVKVATVAPFENRPIRSGRRKAGRAQAPLSPLSGTSSVSPGNTLRVLESARDGFNDGSLRFDYSRLMRHRFRARPPGPRGTVSSQDAG